MNFILRCCASVVAWALAAVVALVWPAGLLSLPLIALGTRPSTAWGVALGIVTSVWLYKLARRP